MAYWDCPRCAAENPLDATCCWRCGFQNYGSGRAAAGSAEPPASGTNVVKKQREGLEEEMKKSVDEALERTRAALDRLAGGRRGPGSPTSRES